MLQVLHSWRLFRINVESSINQIFFFMAHFSNKASPYIMKTQKYKAIEHTANSWNVTC